MFFMMFIYDVTTFPSSLWLRLSILTTCVSASYLALECSLASERSSSKTVTLSVITGVSVLRRYFLN